MVYSKLFKKYYPFQSGADILLLDRKERHFLLNAIKHYPGCLGEKMLRARRNGVQVEGWEQTRGVTSRLFPSRGLVDVLMDLQQKCDQLVSKIEKDETLTDGDLSNINRIIYANKYCRPWSWFLCPTPDGRVSAVME